MWAIDPLLQWREGVGLCANKDNWLWSLPSPSNLLQVKVPLCRLGLEVFCPNIYALFIALIVKPAF
jgi:hypothetical protein